MKVKMRAEKKKTDEIDTGGKHPGEKNDKKNDVDENENDADTHDEADDSEFGKALTIGLWRLLHVNVGC